MKIIYYSSTFFADCDFPLIRELQRMGHDVRYYIPIASYNLKSTLLNLDKIYPHTGIYPATVYEGFNVYKDEIDLSKVYVVNQKYKQKYHPLNLLLMLRLVIHFIMQRADIIHLTKEPSLITNLLYLLKRKLVLTVHDPFLHSSSYNKKWEKRRMKAYKKIKKLVLLNKTQIDSFIDYYNIPKSHVFINKLGAYDSISRIKPQELNVAQPYILFFGGISKYKGLDYLMEAMLKVHKKHPNLRLVIAGGGRLWFDIEKYKKYSCFEFRHYYVNVEELAGLLRGCEFSVCPYRDATQSGVVQTALSMGVPLIVTNVGALPEVVTDGEYGMVIEPNNVDAIFNAICDLYEDKLKLSQMRKNIKDSWFPSMSWTPIAKQYVECYKAVVE